MFPRDEFNTNCGLLDPPRGGGGSGGGECRFIFHATGSWNKLEALHRMLLQTGTTVPPVFSELDPANWLQKAGGAQKARASRETVPAGPEAGERAAALAHTA